VNTVVLTYIRALVKVLYKTNPTFYNLVPLKTQSQNMLHMWVKHTQNSNDTHQMKYLLRSVRCVNFMLNETVQDIPGQAHFIDVASHQLASCQTQQTI
jgi:hypothetical protein